MSSTTPRNLLLAGLASTVLVALLPVLDVATVDSIGDHVREAYPQWSADSVAADRAAITGYLVALGLLGAIGWAWTLRLLPRRPTRARTVAATMLVLGALMALTTLSYGGEAYDTIVPLPYGVLGLVPVGFGVAAVVRLWQHAATVGSREPLGLR
jgi:hypothetical protein